MKGKLMVFTPPFKLFCVLVHLYVGTLRATRNWTQIPNHYVALRFCLSFRDLMTSYPCWLKF